LHILSSALFNEIVKSHPWHFDSPESDMFDFHFPDQPTPAMQDVDLHARPWAR